MERSISDRMQNWERWANQASSSSSRCMTGTVCESLRKAALGNVWSGHSGIPTVDAIDAQAVERAWRSLLPLHRDLLLWHHINRARAGWICRRLKIPAQPASVFEIHLAHAELALLKTLERQAAAK
jgi:hypothetical protein